MSDPNNEPSHFDGPPLSAYDDLPNGDDFGFPEFAGMPAAASEPAPYETDGDDHSTASIASSIVPLTAKVDKILAELDEFQRAAATAAEPALCFAGAGSGKTKTLTARVAWLIGYQGVRPERIFCCTFTNKAAGEMRKRISHAVGAGAVPQWIGTFHGLMLRILRGAPETVRFNDRSLDPGFKVIDPDDARRLFRLIALEDPEIARLEKERLDRRKAARDAARISLGASEAIAEDEEEDRAIPVLLHELVSIWKESILAPDSPSLTKRDPVSQSFTDPIIANSLAALELDDEYAAMAVRLYPRYQAKMIEENCVDFSDLIMWPILRFRADMPFRARISRKFDRVLIDEYQDVNPAQAELVRHLCSQHGNAFVVGDDGQSIYGFRGADIRFIREFEKDFSSFGRPVSVCILRKNYRSNEQIVEAGRRIVEGDERIVRKNIIPVRGAGAALSFNAFPSGFAEAAGVASTIQENVAKGGRFGDHAILYRAKILSKPLQQIFMERRIPFVVYGDTALYASKEAKDIGAFVRLALNPGSIPDFRRVANEPKRGAGEKTVEGIIDQARDAGMPIIEYLAAGRATGRGVSALKTFADAVMSFAAALREGPLVSFVLGHPEATPFWTSLAVSLPGAGLSLERALNEVANGSAMLDAQTHDMRFAEKALIEYTQAIEKPETAQRWLSRPIMKFLEKIGYIAALKADREKGEKRLSNVVFICESADGHAEPMSWLDELALALDTNKEGADAVQLMTIHGSKGLEFPSVFIVGMDEGILPSFGALKTGREDEERRIAYVGQTRAEKRLYLSTAASRMTWTGPRDYEPSRYLSELPRNLFDANSQARLAAIFDDASAAGPLQPATSPRPAPQPAPATRFVQTSVSAPSTAAQDGDFFLAALHRR